ncbi:MAG: serine O-acetyltransferase [Alphaproteobacteria bacterium]|nr:serine O-acetyltransferase [Alphaproteobacteria bacterium]
MFDHLRYIQKCDPANPTFAEVLFAYNGYHAIFLHRMNNFIWHLGLRGVARFFANLGRIFTGIEIHPEARIGNNVFIDHGTGCVIGQTAIVEDDVTMYHGVTLGGVGKEGQVDGKRHPTLKKGSIVGAGAQVLGDITIGEYAKVGANSVVTTDIPDGCVVIGIPARVVCKDCGTHAYGMPSSEEMKEVMFIIDRITGEMEDIKKELDNNGNSSEKAAAN